ncbi:MAG TPA: thioredoxin family protein [Thermoanaerobaculia bacterium]|nr:thioredoxin family protein [Thermoanaerobaculia bacterium]
MEAEVYPNPTVAEFIDQNFIPVRLHVKTHPEAMARFNVQWTPTVLILDFNGVERHRIEGFLETEDFLAQLELGAAKVAFANSDFANAEQRFRAIVEKLPKTDAAAEALYWAGVSKYKGSGDAAALGATAKAFTERYSDSSWAKKSKIWAA